jgi:hypothetical protein
MSITHDNVLKKIDIYPEHRIVEELPEEAEQKKPKDSTYW